MTLYPVEACPLQLDTSHSVALTASTAQIAWGGFPQWCSGDEVIGEAHLCKGVFWAKLLEEENPKDLSETRQ